MGQDGMIYARKYVQVDADLKLSPSSFAITRDTCFLAESAYRRGSDSEISRTICAFERLLTRGCSHDMPSSLQILIARRWVALELRFQGKSIDLAIQYLMKMIDIDEDCLNFLRLLIIDLPFPKKHDMKSGSILKVQIFSKSMNETFLNFHADCARAMDTLFLGNSEVDAAGTSVFQAISLFNAAIDDYILYGDIHNNNRKTVGFSSPQSPSMFDMLNAKLSKAELYQRIGLHNLALDAASAAVHLDPTNLQARLILARTYFSYAILYWPSKEAQKMIAEVHKQLEIWSLLRRDACTIIEEKLSMMHKKILLHCKLLSQDNETMVVTKPSLGDQFSWLCLRSYPCSALNIRIELYQKQILEVNQIDSYWLIQSLQELAALQIRDADTSAAEKTLQQTIKLRVGLDVPMLRLALLHMSLALSQTVYYICHIV